MTEIDAAQKKNAQVQLVNRVIHEKLFKAVFTYLKSKGSSNQSLVHFIDVLVKANGIPHIKSNEQQIENLITVESMLRDNQLATLKIMQTLVIDKRFRFETKSILDLLSPHCTLPQIYAADLFSLDDEIFITAMRNSSDFMGDLKKMILKCDNFLICGKILRAFWPTEKGGCNISFIKQLITSESVNRLDGSVFELVKHLPCLEEEKDKIRDDLINEWGLTLKGKVNQNKRKRDKKENTNKNSDSEEDNDDFDDDDNEDESGDDGEEESDDDSEEGKSDDESEGDEEDN